MLVNITKDLTLSLNTRDLYLTYKHKSNGAELGWNLLKRNNLYGVLACKRENKERTLRICDPKIPKHKYKYLKLPNKETICTHFKWKCECAKLVSIYKFLCPHSS